MILRNLEDKEERKGYSIIVMCSCQADKGQLCQLTCTRAEGASNKELPPLDWLVGIALGHFTCLVINESGPSPLCIVPVGRWS